MTNAETVDRFRIEPEEFTLPPVIDVGLMKIIIKHPGELVMKK
jgi:hypothetical protein